MAITLEKIKRKKDNRNRQNTIKKNAANKAAPSGSSFVSNPIKRSDGTAINGSLKNKSGFSKTTGQRNAAKPLSDMIAMQFSGNAVARNNAIAGAKVYDAAKSYSNRSKEMAARYKRIAATKEIQDKAKGQSYLKKELPKSGLMLGGDPVARNRAIQTGIKANATEEEREAQAAKDLIAAANSPVERFMQGLGRGLALGPTTRFSWQEETPTEKMVSDLTNNTVSGAAGNMVGEALPYLMAYGKLGGAVGDAAMKLPGAAKLGGLGQGVVKSLAADTVLGAPLNANYVVNKQGLRGKEAVKEFAKQEALDLGLGVGMEGLSHFIRNRAKAVTHYDYDKINEQIGKMFKNELPVQEVFNFGKTPKAIQKYGAENLDMTMSQATLRKIVYPKGYFGGEHNLGFNAIEFLRGQIENPVAVLKSNTQKDSLVIVTELLDAENNLVIVPLHLNKQGQLGISNTIPSMYGKKEFDKFINTQRDMGNILFEDKKRIITAPLSGLQLPGLVANNDPMIRISQTGGKVKENVADSIKKSGNKTEAPLDMANDIVSAGKAAKPISNMISDQMSRSSKPAAESARERFFDFSRKLYTETVDNLHPLARLDEKVKILSSNMRKSKGTADSILHNGMVDMAGKNIAPSIDGVTRTLDDVFASAATADKKAFNEYLLHKVNAERAPRGKGILENVSAQDSRNAIKELEKSYPQFKTYADFIYANIDILIDEWYVKSGLISKELGEKLKKMYRNYVPVMRDGITNTEGFNKKVISAAQMVKTAKGGNNPIIAPDVALAIHMEKAVRAARTNELNLELLNIVRKNPEKFDGAIKLADGNITKYDNTILKGGTELLNEEGLDAMDNVLDNLMGKDIKGNYYVVAMENGKPVRMNVNEEIYNALKTLQRNPSDETATKMLNIVNRYWSGPFKALITGLNPFFAVRNAIRDIPTAYIQGTENNVFRFVRNLIDATRGIVKNDPMFQEYVALGGKQGGYFNVEGGLGAPTGIKKKLSKPVELITAINELTEAAPRYAEYLGTLKRSEGGLKNASYDDIQRALYNSGEVTVNFGRYGDVTKTVDKFVPYLNPAVQGIDKFFRSMGSSPATAAKAAMVLSIPTVALHLYNEAYHKEDYERLDDRTKDTYYCFYIPNSDGKFVRIPKSREAGVLFSVLPERMIRYIGGDDEAFRGFGNTVATNFAPQSPVENNILAPAVYYLPQNKDFAGRTIVPDRLKDLYAYEQYDEKTSEMAKWLGSAAAELGINNGEGLSPKQIDYIIDSYTGIIGDVLIPATTEGGNVFEKVVTGPFIADNVYSNNIQNDFYSAMDSMNKERNHVDMTGGAEAQWRTPEDRMYSYYLAASKEMSDLRKKERELAVLPNSKEKSEAQRELRKQINAIAEEALAGADAAYAGYKAEYVPEISDMSESRQEFYREKLKPLGMEASEYKRLFNSFDLDGNKSISQKEVKEVLDASGLSETKKALMFEAACPNAKKNPYR